MTSDVRERPDVAELEELARRARVAIVKAIVEHHGGKVWVESEVGKGCKFSMMIPIRKERRGGDEMDELL